MGKQQLKIPQDQKSFNEKHRTQKKWVSFSRKWFSSEEAEALPTESGVCFPQRPLRVLLSYVAIYLFHESLYDNSNIYSRTLLISNSYGANIKKAACLLGKTVQLFIVRKGYTMPSSNLKRFIFSDACSTKEHLILLVVAVIQSLVFASYFRSHLICQVNLTYLLT